MILSPVFFFICQQAYAASNAYTSLLENPEQLCSIQAFNVE